MINIAYFNDSFNLGKFSGLPWIYLGTHKGINYIKGILDENNRIFVAKDIEQITDIIRDNFIDFIGKLSICQDDKIIWYCSRMASKSVSQNTMFQQYVYLKLIDRLISENREILFVTDDYELLNNAKKIFMGRINLSNKNIFYKKTFMNKIINITKILRYFFLWSVCKFLRNKEINKFDIIIHSWINERVFTRLPRFCNSNFGDLEDFLENKGYKVGCIVPIFLPLKYIDKLKKHFRNIIFPLSYLSLQDFLKSIFIKFTINKNALSKDNFENIKDLDILIKLSENEVSKENCSLYFLNYLLSFYAYKNLSRSLDKNVSFIYPFENQPWEKMFNIALSKFNRIAYQHSTIPYNWLDYRVSKYENTDSYSPRVILTAGKKWSSFLKENYRNILIKELGAIRFSYLFDRDRKMVVNSEERNIVIAFPISTSISISLYRQLLNLLATRKDLSAYTIKIKPHPYSKRFDFPYKDCHSYKNCTVVKNEFAELLNDCNLLITSGSSVAFESVLLGIKTLYLIPEELSYGIEHFIKDNLFIAHEDDFSDKFDKALNSPVYPNANIEEYFSRPDFNIVLDILESNKN
ncbi:MAG: hypothetical protein PHS93_04345 [Candidatus Omnitrophica bacterium]|nr:hypothetical protein [Candidatus Omnitrophota bacterium]MDD5352380.1 hypothetical protein [Candidatus Omnitrophota bacterium]MDD5549978.1 hypothetical protein [Candidatus Omnitrophota bacterium]